MSRLHRLVVLTWNGTVVARCRCTSVAALNIVHSHLRCNFPGGRRFEALAKLPSLEAVTDETRLPLGGGYKDGSGRAGWTIGVAPAE